ncbi:MAG TPA: hypothetical protein VKU82_05765 [Planctomycetaceae bacterium]|nr:hypothetical protein [Planctomycetaceae bacterium]
MHRSNLRVVQITLGDGIPRRHTYKHRVPRQIKTNRSNSGDYSELILLALEKFTRLH